MVPDAVAGGAKRAVEQQGDAAGSAENSDIFSDVGDLASPIAMLRRSKGQAGPDAGT